MTAPLENELVQWLEDLLDLIEHSQAELDRAEVWRLAMRDEEEEESHRTRQEIDDLVWERVGVFGPIAARVVPGIADKFDTTNNPSLWRWFDLELKVRMVLGIGREQECIDELLGPQGPVLAVEGMHPELAATAARLFDQGHYREAVPRAARRVNELTADKLELAGIDNARLARSRAAPRPTAKAGPAGGGAPTPPSSARNDLRLG